MTISLVEDAARRIAGSECVELEPVPDAVSASGRKFYVAGNRRFFIKTGGEKRPNTALIECLSNLPSPAFRTPRFYGFEGGVEVWEYIDGSSRPISSYSEEKLDALVGAVAATETFLKPPDDLPHTHWLLPAPKTLQASKLRVLREIESTLLTRGLGSAVIHNDIHSFNVMRVGETFVAFDWESASLGSPGASLRALVEWPHNEAREIAERYAFHASQHGNSVEATNVLCSMMVHQMYWALHTGVRQRKPDRIERGWRLLDRLMEILK